MASSMNFDLFPTIEVLPMEILENIVSTMDMDTIKALRMAVSPRFTRITAAVLRARYREITVSCNGSEKSRLHALAENDALKNSIITLDIHLVEDKDIRVRKPDEILTDVLAGSRMFGRLRSLTVDCTNYFWRRFADDPWVFVPERDYTVWGLPVAALAKGTPILVSICKELMFRLSTDSNMNIDCLTLVNLPPIQAYDEQWRLKEITNLKELNVLYTRESFGSSSFMTYGWSMGKFIDHNSFANLTVLAIDGRAFCKDRRSQMTVSTTRFPVLKRLCLRKFYFCDLIDFDWIFTITGLESLCFDSCAIILFIFEHCDIDPRFGSPFLHAPSVPMPTLLPSRTSLTRTLLRWSQVFARLKDMVHLKLVDWQHSLVKPPSHKSYRPRYSWSGIFSARYIYSERGDLKEGSTHFSGPDDSTKSQWSATAFQHLVGLESSIGPILSNESYQLSSAAYRRMQIFYDGKVYYLLRHGNSATGRVRVQGHGLDRGGLPLFSIRGTKATTLNCFKDLIIKKADRYRIYFTTTTLCLLGQQQAQALHDCDSWRLVSDDGCPIQFGLSTAEDKDDRDAYEDLRTHLQSETRSQERVDSCSEIVHERASQTAPGSQEAGNSNADIWFEAIQRELREVLDTANGRGSYVMGM